MKINKKELWRTVKFILFSISAGAIQLGTTAILLAIWPSSKFSMGPMLFYIIGLILSVIWNLTFNRKFTFKSVANYPIALAKTIGFYIIFAPASALLAAWLTNGDIFSVWTITHLGWPDIVGTIICMIINLALEFPFQRYVVFGKSLDSNVKNKEVEKNNTEDKDLGN